jgi:Mrp family chromosome partitioning ATPase
MSRPVPPRGRPGAPPAQEVNPLQQAHALLRGRYLWAIGLGAVLGVSAAVLGWLAVHPVYVNSGLISFREYQPRVLFNTEESGVMPRFDSYLQTQRMLVTSPRVIAIARESEHWQPFVDLSDPDDENAFRESINAYLGSGSTMSVAFQDEREEAVTPGVRAVIEAYQQVQADTDRGQEGDRLRLLDRRRADLATRANSLELEILQFGNEYGPDGVEVIYRGRIDQLRRLEEKATLARTELRQVRSQIAKLEEGDATAEAMLPDDPVLRDLHWQLQSQQADLASLIERLGENNRSVRVQKRRIMQTQGLIDIREGDLARGAEDIDLQGPASSGVRRLQVEESRLTALLDDLESLTADARTQLAAASEQKAKLMSLKQEQSDVRGKLREVSGRIDALNVESAMGDRIDVISYGDSEPKVANASKRMQAAVAGGMGGVMLGFGAILALGFVNRKIGHPDDLALTGKSLNRLTMLPEILPGDELATEFARHALHQLRMILQVGSGQDTHHVWAITSPESGSGKTSLVTALGMSFAASGVKTLLIDLDLNGGGLSHRMNVNGSPRLGAVLAEQQVVGSDQIEAALSDPNFNGTRLGDRLIALGLATEAQIGAAAEAQREVRRGVLDVADGLALSDAVCEADIPNLWVLPRGHVSGDEAGRLNRQKLLGLLDQARNAYEVVLVDTGPAPGATETTLISSNADGVLLVTSRGEQTRRLTNCVTFLESVGSRIVGCVYNRASRRDLTHSATSTSMSARSVSRGAASDHDPLTDVLRPGGQPAEPAKN